MLHCIHVRSYIQWWIFTRKAQYTILMPLCETVWGPTQRLIPPSLIHEMPVASLQSLTVTTKNALTNFPNTLDGGTIPA